MAEVDKPLLVQAVMEWRAAPHKNKGQVLREWLAVLGIGRDAFYREAKGWGRMRERKTRLDHKQRRIPIPEIEKHVEAIITIKHRPPAGVRRGSTENALLYAVENTHLTGVPPEMLDVPLGTINRIARELNLRAASERQVRFEAQYANQVHQFDASHSEHFIAHRKDGDDWILKLAQRWIKNKDRTERVKVIAYGVCDDYSGYRLSRYTVGAGESALASIDFLKWAWSAEAAHAPFMGCPDELYVDNGPLARHTAFEAFAERLGLTVTAHMPYKSRCTGKVENNWRTQWKNFETNFFFNKSWQTFQISLFELNQELAAFWRNRWNQRSHRRLPLSREEAWHQSALERGVIRIEPDAWDHIFTESGRCVDAAGCFSFHGEIYQVAGQDGSTAPPIWDCKAKIFSNIRDGSLIVQDQRDGKRYRAVPFKPMAWGEFQGSPKSELEILKEADAAAPAYAAPPTWRREEDNLVHLPPRAAEVRESGFEMPEIPPLQSPLLKGGASLEEMAAGVEVVQHDVTSCDTEQLFATPWERYEHLIKKEARGERLTPEDVEFGAWFKAEYAELLSQVGYQESRGRLAVVE